MSPPPLLPVSVAAGTQPSRVKSQMSDLMTDKGSFQGTTSSEEFMTMEMLRKVSSLDC